MLFHLSEAISPLKKVADGRIGLTVLSWGLSEIMHIALLPQCLAHSEHGQMVFLLSSSMKKCHHLTQGDMYVSFSLQDTETYTLSLLI